MTSLKSYQPDDGSREIRYRKLAAFGQDTLYMWTALIFRMCIYSTRIYRAQAIPACSMHMHAPQNKASSLGGALQRLHSLLSGTSCWRSESADFGLRPTRFSLPVSRHYEQTHTRTRFGFVRGSVPVAKERVIASSLSRQCSRDPFGKPWNCVSYREIDRVNCAPVGERVPDLWPYRAAQST